jgi:hypothetical protein
MAELRNHKAPSRREGPESVGGELLAQKGHRARTDYLFPTEPSALKNKAIHTLRKLLTIPEGYFTA